MRVNVERLNGVESVEVSLAKAIADVRLKAGNSVTLPQLARIVTDNGFKPVEAMVTVVGDLALTRNEPVLQITGTAATLAIRADPKHADTYRSLQTELLSGAPPIRLQILGLIQFEKGQPGPATLQSAMRVPADR